MTTVYVETNFLMAIAKGQDVQATNLVCNPPNSVRIFVPNICYVEAISTYRLEEKNGRQFEEDIKKKIRELRRDTTSTHAQSFLGYLEEASIENQGLINDIRFRLYEAIEQLNNNAKLIYLEDSEIKNICQKMLNESEDLPVKNDIIDNLILRCILNHANLPANSERQKVFISGNSRDFNTSEVKEAFSNADIRYFTSTQHFLDWFNARAFS